MWLKSRFVQKLGGGFLERFALRTWSRIQFAAMKSRKDWEAIKLIQDVHYERHSLLSAFEPSLSFRRRGRSRSGREHSPKWVSSLAPRQS